MGDARITQLPIEALTQYSTPYVRVTQIAGEGVWQYAAAIRRVRVTQIAVEVIRTTGCFPPPPPPPPTIPACPVVFETDPLVPPPGCNQEFDS
jgi:hypothetical protein